MTVLVSAGFCQFDTQTPTRLSNTVSEIGLLDDGFIAAIAAAQPLDWLYVSDRDKATEAMTRDIDGRGHGDLHERLLCQVAGQCGNAGPPRILELL